MASLPAPYPAEEADVDARGVATLPLRGDQGNRDLAEHLHGVVERMAFQPFRLSNVCPGSLVVVDAGHTYVALQIHLDDISVEGHGEPFPVVAGHGDMRIEGQPANGQFLHFSIAFGVRFESWDSRHRAIIKARSLLAGCQGVRLFMSFEAYRRSPTMKLREPSEVGILCKMLREVVLEHSTPVVGMEGPESMHLSWQYEP